METDTLSADTQSVDTAEVDPLQDLTDEQLYQLVEETLWVSRLDIYLTIMPRYVVFKSASLEYIRKQCQQIWRANHLVDKVV